MCKSANSTTFDHLTSTPFQIQWWDRNNKDWHRQLFLQSPCSPVAHRLNKLFRQFQLRRHRPCQIPPLHDKIITVAKRMWVHGLKRDISHWEKHTLPQSHNGYNFQQNHNCIQKNEFNFHLFSLRKIICLHEHVLIYEDGCNFQQYTEV